MKGEGVREGKGGGMCMMKGMIRMKGLEGLVEGR